MFKPNTPLYLKDVVFTTEVGKDLTRKVVSCVFMVQPFTRELAASVDMQNRLFSITDGEPLPDIIQATLAAPAGLKQMAFKMAPDQGRESMTARAVRIGPFKIRKDKEGPVYACSFTASFYYPEPNDLMFLANGVNEQHFVTFNPEQDDMLTSAEGAPELKSDIEEDGDRRRKKREKPEVEVRVPVGV